MMKLNRLSSALFFLALLILSASAVIFCSSDGSRRLQKPSELKIVFLNAYWLTGANCIPDAKRRNIPWKTATDVFVHQSSISLYLAEVEPDIAVLSEVHSREVLQNVLDMMPDKKGSKYTIKMKDPDPGSTISRLLVGYITKIRPAAPFYQWGGNYYFFKNHDGSRTEHFFRRYFVTMFHLDKRTTLVLAGAHFVRDNDHKAAQSYFLTKAINEFMRKFVNPGRVVHLMVVGDFNERDSLSLNSYTSKTKGAIWYMRNEMNLANPLLLGESRQAEHEIDHVFISKSMLDTVSATYDNLAKLNKEYKNKFSDHSPVVVTIDLTKLLGLDGFGGSDDHCLSISSDEYSTPKKRSKSQAGSMFLPSGKCVGKKPLKYRKKIKHEMPEEKVKSAGLKIFVSTDNDDYDTENDSTDNEEKSLLMHIPAVVSLDHSKREITLPKPKQKNHPYARKDQSPKYTLSPLSAPPLKSIYSPSSSSSPSHSPLTFRPVPKRISTPISPSLSRTSPPANASPPPSPASTSPSRTPPPSPASTSPSRTPSPSLSSASPSKTPPPSPASASSLRIQSTFGRSSPLSLRIPSTFGPLSPSPLRKSSSIDPSSQSPSRTPSPFSPSPSRTPSPSPLSPSPSGILSSSSSLGLPRHLKLSLNSLLRTSDIPRSQWTSTGTSVLSHEERQNLQKSTKIELTGESQIELEKESSGDEHNLSDSIFSPESIFQSPTDTNKVDKQPGFSSDNESLLMEQRKSSI